jgi:RNA polymerase sigma-54 factor
VEYEDGKVTFHLNRRNLPELKISKSYAAMLEEFAHNKENQTNDQKEAALFVKQKLDAARCFIEAIRQRHSTLSMVMKAIIDFQGDYFIDGDPSKLKPMILKDIANIVGLDASTVSRVSSSKYCQTPFGIFPLKHFFSEAVQTMEGEDVSTRAIKEIIKESIESEDKQSPYTDDKLAEILAAKQYKIARRTIAKYREQLGIPVARMRKEL